MVNRTRFVQPGWIVMAVCSLVIARTEADDAKGDKPDAPTAESVLRRTTDFFKKAKSVAVEVERTQKIGSMTIPMKVSVAFQRPNRFAVRAKDGGPTPGVTVVSDGKTMFVSITALQKYTQADAPASLDALEGDPIVMSSLQGMIVGELCTTDPYANVMQGVKTAKYAGLDTLEGVKAHHLTFTQDQFDWEMWVAAEGDPIVVRVVADLSKAMTGLPGAEQLKGQKLELIATYKDWRIDGDLGEKAFTFEPPKGSQKVDNLFEGILGGDHEAPSPLLGKPAPAVDLKRLDEGRFRLKDQRDAKVVMLDFWATWCGPCVQELPILAEVADAYKDKGVVFCAVNQREEPDEINKFLKEKKLKITVALDADGAIGDAYHVEGIPTLALIDKKGVIQSVHVGYSPSIKATLKKELDALLAGKDLAKEAGEAVKAKPSAKAEGLEQAWSVSGPYSSVAADPKGGTIFAVQKRGVCDVLDASGKTTRTFHLSGDEHMIARFARLRAGEEGLLAFNPWGPSVLASKGDGTKLWEEVGGQGIDDVWAADLDGDGSDEVIVGYNGNTGLHVFSAEGKRLWERTDLGNVWHVTAGDLDGDGKLEVVTTSAQGKVHLFAPKDGKPLRMLDAGLYANVVRTAPGRAVPSSSKKGDVALVVGAGDAGEAMVALGGDEKALWTLKLPADSRHCDSMAVSPDGTWAALGLRGGRVCVVDVGRGQIVAQTTGQGSTPMVAWTSGDKTTAPLLLVATGRDVGAYRVKPPAALPEQSRP